MKVLLVCAAALTALVIACGGGDEPAATATTAPVAQPTQAPTMAATVAPTVAPTRVPTPTRAAAPTAAPTPTAAARKEPTGSLAAALPSVGAPLFLNSQAAFPRNLMRIEWGICEPLASVDRNDPTKVVPIIAKSWQISTDGKTLEFRLNRGIKFHKGWGELTAEDVAWSYNEGGADNAASIAGGGAQLYTTYDPWEARGVDTVLAPFDKPQTDPFQWQFINGGPGSGHCTLSKKLFDSVGKDKMITTPVGTGPWEVDEWTAGVKLQAHAVKDHWRIVPGFNTLTLLEVPEEQTRVAMIKSGQVDISETALKSVKDLRAAGFVSNDTLKNFFTAAVFMGGNYWYDPQKDLFQGKPVQARPGFKPDDAHPWIGNPKDAARHEKAKKVRQAMAHAIDRETINSTILGGLGTVAYVPGIPLNAPDWNDKWKVQYDPALAKKLLADAGYPNGFSFDFWIPSDFPNVDIEVAQAVAAMWQNVGIKANQQLLAYTAGRPKLLTKEHDAPWMWFMIGDAINYDNGHLRSARYLSHTGWNGGVEIPELDDFINRRDLAAPDRARQILVFKERQDWLREWMPFASVADIPKLWVVNPKKVKGWQMYAKGEPGIPNSFETAGPAQ
jgi:peptide/nickel transport system substrate-binding protein